VGRGIIESAFFDDFVSRICMLNLNLLAFIFPQVSTFIRTDGHGYRPLYGQSYIDSAIDSDQEYIYSNIVLLPVSTNVVYPFTLRETGINTGSILCKYLSGRLNFTVLNA